MEKGSLGTCWRPSTATTSWLKTLRRKLLEEALSLIDLNEIVNLTCDLIGFPSLTESESEILRYVEAYCQKKGLPYQILGARENQPNLVAAVGDPRGKTLAFNGHLDVVPICDPSMWESDPFKARIHKGRIYGRGAVDMKSSCAVKLHILDILKKLEDRLRGTVRVEMVSDEERGGRHGTGYLMELIQAGRLQRPDWVIIGEKSDLKIRCAERGTFIYRVTIKGRATHTFSARVDGVNAVYLAARVISQLERPFTQAHPLVGYPVISVNYIQGGKAFNQVPAICEFVVDRRTVPGETLEGLKDEAVQILEGLKREYDFTYHLEVLSHSEASMTDQTEPIVKVFETVLQDVPGVEPEFFLDWAGGTDGKYYRKLGVPTIIYGPLGDHRHGPNEYVRIDSLETLARVYLGVALSLLA